MTREVCDIENQVELLDQMLEDAENVDVIFQPTNYWSFYQEHIIKYLRNEGLQGFRSSHNEYLSAFGARDLHPIKAPLGVIKGISSSDEEAKKYMEYLVLCANHPHVDLLPFDVSLNDLSETAFRMTEAHGFRCGAKPINEVAVSLVGNPEYYFSVDGKPYTYSFLNAYWRYCFCCQNVDFETVDTIVELGMGSGKQAELIKKLYPHITFYLLDLPPQAYLTGQYLKSVFSSKVKDYSEFRSTPTIRSNDESINVLCNWQMESLNPQGNVLFWNAASFGEMEPNVVEKYLSIAGNWSNYIYLHQCMGGKEVGEENKGGVLEQTTFEDYQRILSESYDLLAKSPAYGPLKRLGDSGGYEDAIWRVRA